MGREPAPNGSPVPPCEVDYEPGSACCMVTAWDECHVPGNDDGVKRSPQTFIVLLRNPLTSDPPHPESRNH